MIKITQTALILGAFVLFGGIGIVHAKNTDWNRTATAYTAHQQYQSYIETLSDNQRFQLEHFLEYEYARNESCEGYVEPPEGFEVIKCKLYYPANEKMVRVPEQAIVMKNVVKSYETNFAYDSYSLEPKAVQTMDELAMDIKKYNPRQVTVAGHTDTAGPAAYNAKLSQKRAQTVADALNERGINAMVLDKRAYGENDLAVKTDDGVPLRENRRVMIDFRK